MWWRIESIVTRSHRQTETTTAIHPVTAELALDPLTHQMHRHHPEYDAGPRRDPVLHDVPPQFDAAAEVHLVGHQIRAIGQERQPPQPQWRRVRGCGALSPAGSRDERRGRPSSGPWAQPDPAGDAHSAAGQHSSARESWVQALELLGNIRPPTPIGSGPRFEQASRVPAPSRPDHAMASCRRTPVAPTGRPPSIERIDSHRI